MADYIISVVYKNGALTVAPIDRRKRIGVKSRNATVVWIFSGAPATTTPSVSVNSSVRSSGPTVVGQTVTCEIQFPSGETGNEYDSSYTASLSNGAAANDQLMIDRTVDPVGGGADGGPGRPDPEPPFQRHHSANA